MSKLKLNLNKLRNIGIIAHIDAGKTTLTEMILFYAGMIHKFGCVHEGSTTTDHLAQERERGITIVSASVTVFWKDVKINLIDTPGHLDFNNEVEKCLCVLEGAVVVIDGSAGVEPQTECVWAQANNYNVGRIIFMNKMDKDNADFEMSMESLRNRLSKKCINIHVPYYVNFKFKGVYNIIDRKRYVDLGREKEEIVDFEDLTEDEKNLIMAHRSELIEFIADHDDEIMEKHLGGEEIEDQKIDDLVALLVKELKIYPVLCGSAFKDSGVRYVLDHIIKYLPNPEYTNCDVINKKTDVVEKINIHSDEVVGFVFKYVKDEYAGAICYTRLYSGTLKTGDHVFNVIRQRSSRVQKIYEIYANDKKPIDQVTAGNIVGIVVDDTFTSHTICNENSRYQINQIRIPEPIVDVAVTPKTRQDKDKFSNVIQYYIREDPSIRVRYDGETEQIIVSGIGKLQIEVLMQRLNTEKGINLEMNKPLVSYRETIYGTADEDYIYSKQTGGRGQFARMHMKVSRLDDDDFKFTNHASGRDISTAYVEAIKQGLQETLKSGVYKSQIMNVHVEILSGEMHEVDSSADVFRRVASILFKKLLAEAKPALLEPMCKLNIHTPTDYVNNITADVYSKKGDIIDCINADDSKKIITARLSGEYVFDYADKLRSISKGMASFDYQLDGYEKCTSDTLDKHLKYLETQSKRST